MKNNCMNNKNVKTLHAVVKTGHALSLLFKNFLK